MKRAIRYSPLALLLSLFLAGCGDADSPEVSEAPPENPAPESPAPAAVDVPVRLASWEETEQIIAEQQGKVVVLDVWSTWCTPCIREFPNLVALHRDYGDQVACMSLNCNYTGAEGESPKEAFPEIEAFLEQQGATFTNIVSTTPDEELLQIFDAASIPIVRVYDKQGQLRKQFTNDEGEYGEEGFTYERHIAPLVEQLINE